MSVLVMVLTVAKDEPFEFECMPRVGEFISVNKDHQCIVRVSRVTHTPWDNTYDAYIICEVE